MQSSLHCLDRHLVVLGQFVRALSSVLPVGVQPGRGRQSIHGEVGADALRSGQGGVVAVVDDVLQLVQQRQALLGSRQGAVDQYLATLLGGLAGAEEPFDGHLRQRVYGHAVKRGDDGVGDRRLGDPGLGQQQVGLLLGDPTRLTA